MSQNPMDEKNSSFLSSDRRKFYDEIAMGWRVRVGFPRNVREVHGGAAYKKKAAVSEKEERQKLRFSRAPLRSLTEAAEVRIASIDRSF